MRVLSIGILLTLAGCDLTMTLEPVTYAELGEAERAVVDRIYARLQAFDARLQGATGGRYVLGAIAVDHDRVDVSVVDLWVMANIGDDRVHLSAWENLTGEQRERFASWFGETQEAAAGRYGRFFYDFVALHLAGVQTVFSVQGVDWVYRNRSAFNIDRDAERLAVTYLSEVDPGLLGEAQTMCGAIGAALEARFGAWFDPDGYAAHFRELTDPRDPSGQIYMICRQLEDAFYRKVTFNMTFAAELEMLEARRSGEGTTITGM
ncbi:MAG: hypothetical protein HY905_14220 [Deltaproteobacteria bacterium]|nr:hypothetical protein [Deltaproteobacteria bacterium]